MKYTDFEKLLSAPDIDVFIVTPPFEHPRMLEAAIQAKKHLYCEKPIGVDGEGVKRAMAGRRPTSLQAHSNRCHRRTGQCPRILDCQRSVHPQAL